MLSQSAPVSPIFVVLLGVISRFAFQTSTILLAGLRHAGCVLYKTDKASRYFGKKSAYSPDCFLK